MGNFEVKGVKEAEKIRKQYNLTVIGSHNNGYLQPKTYIFAESEEHVADLMKKEPVVAEPGDPVLETPEPVATFFKHRGRPKNK